MRHELRITIKEKLRACFDLSDFIFNMMKNSLNNSEFNKKLSNLRKKHLMENMALLKNLGKAKNE